MPARGWRCATGSQREPAHGARSELLRRFEYPTPRVKFGRRARGIADRGDGPVRRAGRAICQTGARQRVRGARRCRAPAAVGRRCSRWPTPAQARDWALAAGDDYELLLAVPPARFDELAAAGRPIELNG